MNAVKKGFLIGSATAAHQVEGNNIHNDIWAEEQMKYGGYPEKSGLAADQYHLYREDIDLMKKAGLNAYRFSLEWSRIEPEKGKFDQEAIEHYRDEITCCLQQGIEPAVTLFHFTSPKWLIEEGGWESDSTVEYFARYVRKVAEEYKDLLHVVCTINEANMGVLIGIYIAEARRQAEKQGKADALQIGMNIDALSDEEQAKKEENLRVFKTENPQVFVAPRTHHGVEIIMKANEEAVRILHEVIPGVKAGLSLSVRYVQYTEEGKKNAEKDWQTEFLQFIPHLKEDDFLGIQNYTKTVFGKDGELPVPADEETTEMGYAYYPEGLEHVLRKAHEVWKKDLIVTENGIATQNDARRCAFIQTAVNGVQSCLRDGIPVKGYFYWSFIDNYEWQSGYSMHFGLTGLNHKTMERIVHPSLKLLGSITETF